MSKTMAAVLAEHRMSRQDYAYCICGAELSPEEDGGWTTHEAMEAHQSAALSAAGFGLVADAKAKALEGAVDHAKAFGLEAVYPRSLSARAAALRGDS